MTDHYIDLQRRRDSGELTLAECKRLGSTHAAYGWSCTPDGHFTEEQKQAYKEGHNGR